MAQPVYIVTNDYRATLALLGWAISIPMLAPPAVLLINLWTSLSAMHWHPVFLILAEFLAVAALFWAFVKLFIELEPTIAGVLAAIYTAAAYWFVAFPFLAKFQFQLDVIWRVAIVVVMTAISFFLARAFAKYAKRAKKPANREAAAQA